MQLLEPIHLDDGSIHLLPWNEEERRGSYSEAAGVRIVGSQWYGSNATKVIQPLSEALEALPPAEHTLLMLHMGVEGYLNEYAGGVTYSQLLPLKETVDYLALGHVHKRYQVEDWIFNPGSLMPSRKGTKPES